MTALWWLLGLALSPVLIPMLADVVPGGHVLVPALVVLGALRMLLALFIGSRAADHTIGHLAYDVVVFPFRAVAAVLGLAMRGARW